MSRTWTDRVADNLIDYLRTEIFTEPMRNRQVNMVYLMLLFELMREQKLFHGHRERRIPIPVPLVLAKDLRPGDLDTLNGRPWTLSALWDHLKQTAPAEAASRFITMATTEAAEEVASEVAAERIAATAASPLSVAHRTIETVARFARGSEWEASHVERRKPTKPCEATQIGTLQQVAAAYTHLLGAPGNMPGAGMRKIIADKGPPCHIVGAHALAMPESFGILDVVRVLPTPLDDAWHRNAEAVKLLRTFLRDVLAKVRLRNDGPSLSAGNQKDSNRIERIHRLLRQTIARPPSGGALERTLATADEFERAMMLTYWAFYLRMAEKLAQECERQDRQDLAPSDYSVLGASTFTEFLDTPLAKKLLGLNDHVSLDDDTASAVGSLYNTLADQQAGEIIERIRPQKTPNAKQDAGPGTALECFLDEVAKHCHAQTMGKAAFEVVNHAAERQVWITLSQDYPEPFLYRRKRNPLLERYIKNVVIGSVSLETFIKDENLNKTKSLELLREFTKIRKKYWPEIGRANFIEFFSFEPFVPAGLDDTPNSADGE